MSKPLTTEQAVAKAILKHGDKFDYSNSVYDQNKKTLSVLCKVFGHGEFNPTYANHVYDGSGCPKCAGNIAVTEEEFIERSKEKYGRNTFMYKPGAFLGMLRRTEMKCTADPEHKPFYPVPKDHLQKTSGCPECSGKPRR